MHRLAHSAKYKVMLYVVLITLVIDIIDSEDMNEEKIAKFEEI